MLSEKCNNTGNGNEEPNYLDINGKGLLKVPERHPGLVLSEGKTRTAFCMTPLKDR